ncbi:hypothetical protein AAur_3888 [Paenarthrobacter aurescens TC1]|uniref:Uncharacterized protein n=1 Tax=Paenarthrobacter aurescens (strain TC1) TaxID=290340 RepID=A1RBF2_PAEAT|nr:hypothetical protein AAur_3888 [Paenarthrobacter aurescens TC1]
MLTLQPRQRVGHDILLARHGNHISTMRYDRTNDRIIAMLDDGSWDSAPNMITPGLDMPETISSVFRKDWRFLSLACVAMVTVAALAMGISVEMANNMSTTELQALLVSYPAF